MQVAKVVLDNAPYNAKYTSGLIQKEILSIIANNVRKHIRREVGDSYFCIMVDEARDESKEEKMAIVLRFVDKDGFIRERFLDLVHVYDTMAVTLKGNLWEQLFNITLNYGNKILVMLSSSSQQQRKVSMTLEIVVGTHSSNR